MFCGHTYYVVCVCLTFLGIYWDGFAGARCFVQIVDCCGFCLYLIVTVGFTSFRFVFNFTFAVLVWLVVSGYYLLIGLFLNCLLWFACCCVVD